MPIPYKTTKQVPYLIPTNIKRHSTKMIRHIHLAPGLCAPLIKIVKLKISYTKTLKVNM